MSRRNKAPWRSLFLCCALLLAAGPVNADQAGIATAHPAATRAGIEILQQGGNAFDAAVAISAALAVVEPYGSGLGGGGFWLLHRNHDGYQVMVDGREMAPLAAHRDMYLDGTGQPQRRASIDGPLAAGIPGQPAALVHVAAHYGTLPLARLLQPAITLARQGFVVDEHYRRMAAFRLEALRASPAATSQFLLAGEIPPAGHRIVQHDLAATLEAIAESGFDGFYRGAVAKALVDESRAAGGIWTMQDLAGYKVVEREPIIGRFGDFRIVSAAPPSSGGVALVTMLNMLDRLDYSGLRGTSRVHALVEVMRRAYGDRARYLGDPDFFPVPVEKLTSNVHAKQRLQEFDPARAGVSRALLDPDRGEGTDTTHFSVIDAEGNRVAATLSINYPFGSGFVAPGTGVLLNDEMDDFSLKPGVPNVYGLLGNEANAIAPGKRMLSSMSPTFLEGPDRVVVLGTPGGSRIITMVLLGILEAMEGGSAQQIVDLPRLHHQYLPDRMQFEPDALNDDLVAELRRMGHELDPLERPYGNMQAVIRHRASAQVDVASDSRGVGAAAIVSKTAVAADPAPAD